MPVFFRPRHAEVRHRRPVPFALLPVSIYLIEIFAFGFLLETGDVDSPVNLWPLAFGLIWAGMLTAVLRILPQRGSAVGFGMVYFLSLIYAAVQTGYYLLFQQMLWISDFRYASEGSDYFSVLASYPLLWWLSLLALALLGIWILRHYPQQKKSWPRRIFAGLMAASCILAAWLLPSATFTRDSQIQYAGSDYGRAQSREAAYHNMFNTYRLYQVCGIFQTAAKDIYTNYIFPFTPEYYLRQQESKQAVSAYFQQRQPAGDNAMTGLLEGKNVVLVLMESMDDWMLGTYTPTLNKLLSEGIHFTQFYTPGYGGIRTFNSEFCINTGSFLSSQGGYAFDYVTNSYRQSLANLLRQEGYSALTFHYNDPSFYSRGVFSPAMGYEGYICYADYVEPESKELYDDQLLFDNAELHDTFFRDGKKLNFIITRSAHLSYKYNEVLSYWGLQKYPEFRGLTGNEETDCAYMKAKLVDDLFARLLVELDEAGELQNTVIIGVTDHYTYGYKDEETLYELSQVDSPLLLERTPCFIWSTDLEAQEVDKVLNTSDLLPTVLNLLGVDSPYSYIGHDAFDPTYPGWAPFSDGSWICGNTAYDASADQLMTLDGNEVTMDVSTQTELSKAVEAFVQANNLILDTDYYKNK